MLGTQWGTQNQQGRTLIAGCHLNSEVPLQVKQMFNNSEIMEETNMKTLNKA